MKISEELRECLFFNPFCNLPDCVRDRDRLQSLLIRIEIIERDTLL